MRGLCKTRCGFELEYDPTEFSDGFVYYLPRNLDGTVHNCIFSKDILNVIDDDVALKIFYQKNKDRLKISQSEFLRIFSSQGENPMDFLDVYADLSLMRMIRKGEMFELKKFFENQLNVVSFPFFTHRESDELYDYTDTHSIHLENASDDDLMDHALIDLPTNKGYQLEYLGKLYELMIRLEDAKKCYQLQHETTKEPELLDIIKKLDDKIKGDEKIKKLIPSVIDSNLLKNTIDDIEKKIRQYIIELFSNDMNIIWKRLPWIAETIRGIQEKEQESSIPINEKSDVERLSLGMLNTILKESKSKIRAKSEGKCKTCGKTWGKSDYIYLAKYSAKNTEKPICSDESCFKNQGGLVSDVNFGLINNIYIIRDARNVNSHPRDYDKKMLQNVFRQAFETCTIINDQIDDYLDKKNLI